MAAGNSPVITVNGGAGGNGMWSSTLMPSVMPSKFKNMDVDGTFQINGMDLIQWVNLVNGLLGLPTRDFEMEQKYPQLVDLWFAAVKESTENMKHMVSKPALEYTKKLDEYCTFETLKK